MLSWAVTTRYLAVAATLWLLCGAVAEATGTTKELKRLKGRMG